MLRSSTLCAAFVALGGIAVAGPARADEAADTAAARILGIDGVNLADSGDCQQAVEKLRRSEELHHAPTTAGRLGECEIGVGHLVQGTERLQRLLREPLPASAPAPFVDALARARKVLDRALPRIATLRVAIKAPPRVKFQVHVDADVLPDALIDNDRPTDPGRHVVEVSAQGFLTAKQDVTLADAETANVSLDLVADPNAPPPVPPKPLSAQASPGSLASAPPAKTSSGPNVGAIVSLSFGGLGLAAGIGAGAVVASDSADLSKACGSSKICPPSKQSEISQAKTWATVSTVGFAVGGAGLATGLVLLLIGNHRSDAPTEARIQPVVGPLYVGCEGAF
jgi:hypothetical protein